MRISDWSSDVCSSYLGKEKLPVSLEARAIDNPGLTLDGPVRGEADDHLHRHALGADRGGGSAPAAHDLVVQKNLDRDGSLVWRAPDLLLHAPDIEENVCHAILAAEGRRRAYPANRNICQGLRAGTAVAEAVRAYHGDFAGGRKPP